MKSCSVDANMKNCNCSFPCSRKGICCECISYHRSRGELPGCYFSGEAERSGDRTIAHYMRINS